jgi:folate-binding protein YgfZ
MIQSQFNLLQPDLPQAVFPLEAYRIVKVVGKDAARFLQGQISCNMDEVTEETNQLGTASTPKGRIFSLFRITACEDGFLLRMPESMVDIFESHLRKYIVFFKAEIQTNTAWRVSAILTSDQLHQLFPDLSSQLPESINTTLRQNDQLILPALDNTDRFECWHQDDLAEAPSVFSSPTQLHQADWNWLDMCGGIPELSPEISETFIAQMLNLDHFNALDFKKGCYTGQEIIARMRYLGKLKKRMALFTGNSPSETAPGSWLMDAEHNKVAQVVRTQIGAEDFTLVQAVIPVEHISSDESLNLFDDQGKSLSLNKS